MKKLLMTSAAIATLGVSIAASADAADLPVYVPPPEPIWSWTGPYAGLHVGTIDGDAEANFVFPQDGPPGEADVHFDPNGILGGLQAGYNFQFDSIVVGLEGDISFGDVDDVIYPQILTGSDRAEAQMDWMATIRARLGWTWDRTLFYATGGVAFTDLEIKADIGGGIPASDSDKQSMFGWTVGGGVEHAWTDIISFKAEYLYADFGNEEFSFHWGREELPDVSGDVDLTTHTFRVGVNWLF